MFHIKSAIFASAILVAFSLSSTTGANALPLGSAASNVADQAISEALVHQVQRRGRAFRRGRVLRGGRTPGGRARLRRNRALGIAAGAAVLGGIIGAARNAEAERQRRAEERFYDERAARVRRDRDVEYCINRFRSYNPDTGLYRGFDGRYHPCP